MFERELEVALTVARDAADLLVREAARPGGPRGAGERCPVDREMGDLICRRLREEFPSDDVLCEEGGGWRADGNKRAFLVDPHDGTLSFLRGRRETSVSIGMVDRGRLVLGVVLAPLGTPLTGPTSFQVAWARGEHFAVKIRPTAPAAGARRLTKNALVLVSTNLSPSTMERNREAVLPARVVPCASIATRLALVATGRASLAVALRRPLSSWDFAGGQALLQARGGELVGSSGEAIRWQGVDVAPEHRQESGYFGAGSLELALEAAERYRSLLR